MLPANDGVIICRLFQSASRDTWERIAFSRTRVRMKIHETSITQNLVYEMNMIKWELDIGGFSIFESTNEAAHGDDLEICVVHRDGLVYKFAIQAKILYHSIRRDGLINLEDGKYERFGHITGGRNQVDLLLSYAQLNGCIPLYLLYNYVAGTAMNGDYCGVSFDNTQFGCSLVSALHLKLNHSNATGNLKSNVKFSDLHMHWAIPWFLISCCFPNYQIADTLNALHLPNDIFTRGFTIEEIETDNSGWKILGPNSETATNVNNNFKESQIGFLPKFRMFVNVQNVG